MKKIINEIGDTPKGQYALGQVSARALDRAFSKPKKETNGMVAGNPKYGKVSQDACYAAARGQDDMAKKRGYKRIVDVPDDERHEIGSYFHKGSDDYRQKHTVKLSESQLRNMVAESVKGVLNEIGDTPAGQWMLGRLAGRQQNRAQGKEPGWNTRYGKIKNTTTDAAQYAKSQRQTPYDDYPFYQGRDLENNDWAKDEDNANNYDQQWQQIQGYGDAMSNMIQYHAKQNGNRISESKLKSIISNAIKE